MDLHLTERCGRYAAVMLDQNEMDELLSWLEQHLDTDAEQRAYREHAPVVDGTQSSWTWFAGSESESDRVLRELAATKADRAGYRTGWKPTA